jgi:hypothetical protein
MGVSLAPNMKMKRFGWENWASIDGLNRVTQLDRVQVFYNIELGDNLSKLMPSRRDSATIERPDVVMYYQ